MQPHNLQASVYSFDVTHTHTCSTARSCGNHALDLQVLGDSPTTTPSAAAEAPAHAPMVGGAPLAATVPTYVPPGYAYLAWLHEHKIFAGTDRAGRTVAVKLTSDARRHAHELAMLGVRHRRVGVHVFIVCAFSCCWLGVSLDERVAAVLIQHCTSFILAPLTGESCARQIAKGSGVVAELYDTSAGLGSDGEQWFALVFEHFETTLSGMRLNACRSRCRSGLLVIRLARRLACDLFLSSCV